MSVGVSLRFLYNKEIIQESEVQSMLINKTYKFRIYPNQEKQVLIAKIIGCSCFVFNRFLAMWDNTYKETDRRMEGYLQPA
ncbi:hypothetical protein DN407_31585 (plasmid) [Bacillus sp. JAS24-2]|nr:helix-turn-helix domain-containing protein [Bacillus sp. JAS24-2]QEL82916.1 hypothetical protein DN407_31585 [Bacillus sp. JAS24-2]